ncbi:hypothetical protein VNO80_13920 [Phaseolus coccineus]|uniref:Uncharacterized protein n=1 Tax=Phaseolus coccineus TaxID=3886 RepID=A0AAN9RAD5_PHACN
MIIIRRSGNGGDGGGSAITSQMPTVTVHDAVRYVRKLKYEFRDQKEKFYMFHQVLVDYRNDRINYASLVARAKEILKGHKKLILGFNHFIEKDYEITLHRAAPEEEEVKFMNKIKNRFQSDEPVYNSILEILKMYKEGLKDIGEVSSKLAVHLEDNEDLVEDFNRFLARHGCGDVVEG